MHTFDPKIAEKYGIDAAVLIQNLYWWTEKNIANGKHFHDGRYWTYNSIKAFAKLFTYWTERQVRRIIDKLKKEGVLHEGNYNKTPMDQTKWYALDECILKVYQGTGAQEEVPEQPESEEPEPVDNQRYSPGNQNGQMQLTEPSHAFDQTVKWNCPNGQMQSTEQSNAIDQTVRPIPYIKPFSNPVGNLSCKPDAEIVPPTLEEVRDYCISRKSGIDPVRFFEYYESAGWNDSRGAPVLNWKQKLISWETRADSVPQHTGKDGGGNPTFDIQTLAEYWDENVPQLKEGGQ